jgi:hypothetical protein
MAIDHIPKKCFVEILFRSTIVKGINVFLSRKKFLGFALDT